MRTPVKTIEAGKTVMEACYVMGREHIGSLVVTVDGKPAGIFTERDILSKVILKGYSLRKSTVRQFMSKPLTTIGPDLDVREAARIMAQLRINRLPVLEKSRMLGILTASDIAAAVAAHPLKF